MSHDSPGRRARVVGSALAVLLLAALLLLLFLPKRSEAPAGGPPGGPVAGEPAPSAGERPTAVEGLAAAPRSLRGDFHGRIARASDGAFLAMEGDLVVVLPGGEPLAVRTAPEGTFRIPDLPYPGPAALVLTGDGEGVHHEESRFLQDPAEEILLAVRQRVVVRGTVLRADGAPAGGARVDVRCFDGPETATLAEPPFTTEARRAWLAAQIRVPLETAEARTDAAGAFRAFLDRAPVRAEVTAAGVPGCLDVTVPARSVTPFLLEAEVRLTPSWSVQGTVVGPDGRPLAGVRVVVGSVHEWEPGEPVPARPVGGGGSRTHSFETGRTVDTRVRIVTTDAEGRFEATPVLPAESVAVTVDDFLTRDPSPRTPRVFHLRGVEGRTPGERVDLGTVVLAPPNHQPVVRFLAPDGTPATGILVVFRRADLPMGHPLQTADHAPDAEGRVSSAFLEEGVVYRALLRRRDYGVLKNPAVDFTASPDATVTVE